MYGWEFRSGDNSVTVAETSQKAAEVIAKRHLCGELDGSRGGPAPRFSASTGLNEAVS